MQDVEEDVEDEGCFVEKVPPKVILRPVDDTSLMVTMISPDWCRFLVEMVTVMYYADQ